MPNPLAGGTALAPNCGFEGGAPVAGQMRWGTRSVDSTPSKCAAIKAFHPGMLLRTGLSWGGGVDPGGNGTGFAFGGPDGKIAGRNTCRFLFVLKGGNINGNSYPGLGANTTNYAKCVAALVQRYNSSEVWGIEIYNEPDLATWTGTQVGLVANAAANAAAPMNAAKPAAQRVKILCGTFSGQVGMSSSPFLAQFYDTINGNPNIDYVSFHPYHQGRMPEVNSLGATQAWQTYAQNMISFAAAHGWHGNFCPTEFNTTTDPGHPITTTEEHQAQWLPRQLIMMVAHSGGKISPFFQFSFYTEEAGWPGGCGLIRANGTPKPEYYSYQTITNIIDEATTSITPVTVPSPTTNSPFRYRYDRTGGRYGFAFWVALEGATSNLTLNGLPGSVRKTLRDGAQSIVPTTGGSLTLPASNNLTYLDVVW